ncbi:hypothetical protein [Falsibacillus pallidus]|uniref:hypothetical protein n=1 Tax=Falsibacillus pallidus TaxID=493781 RepID=UPI003D971601
MTNWTKGPVCMQTYFEEISANFKKRNHIHSLMPKEGIRAVFQLEGHEAWLLDIGKDSLSFRETAEEDGAIKISLCQRAFCQLLSGEMMLMKLLKRDGWIVEGSFRSILLLESILWLCRPYETTAEQAHDTSEKLYKIG